MNKKGPGEMLSLENVNKSFTHYGRIIEVLREVNLLLNPADTLAIMGASGVGKSTLLNIMGSLEPPTEGIVRFEGQELYGMTETEVTRFRNKRIGFVFQFHHLLSDLNALENTMMPALIARYSRRKAMGMAKECLAKVGLETRMTHRAGELSGGEQQRVAIARSIIMRPKLILADEPTGNLDWSTGEGVADLLLRFNKEEGVAMVIATHNHRLAEKMSMQMEIMDGKLRQI
jgi:lipoprotein-releasing system ATP-binding protein